MSESELIREFTARAEAVSAVVRTVSDAADVAAYVHDLCAERGATSVAVPGLDEGLAQALEQVVRSEDVALLTSDLRTMSQGFDVGVSRAEAGIAATGTLVLSCLDDDVRLASMLCDVHVCVLPESVVVPDARDLVERLTGRMISGPDHTVFVTGPSRTADIERVLALGVHGPLELHILVEEGA